MQFEEQSIDASPCESWTPVDSFSTEDVTMSEHEVLDLARQFTSRPEHHGSPFAAKDSRLDPKSEKFRARDWATAFYNLRYSSDASLPRVAGVAFKGLNVWGQGSPTDFQSTVGNVFLKLPSLFGKGSKKVEVLRDFEGLVLPGEQLCVLGPPGYVAIRHTLRS